MHNMHVAKVNRHHPKATANTCFGCAKPTKTKQVLCPPCKVGALCHFHSSKTRWTNLTNKLSNPACLTQAFPPPQEQQPPSKIKNNKARQTTPKEVATEPSSCITQAPPTTGGSDRAPPNTRPTPNTPRGGSNLAPPKTLQLLTPPKEVATEPLSTKRQTAPTPGGSNRAPPHTTPTPDTMKGGSTLAPPTDYLPKPASMHIQP